MGLQPRQTKVGDDLLANGWSPAFPEPQTLVFRGLCLHQSNKLLLRDARGESVELRRSDTGGLAPRPETAPHHRPRPEARTPRRTPSPLPPQKLPKQPD